jgi:hypothetical protein
MKGYVTEIMRKNDYEAEIRHRLNESGDMLYMQDIAYILDVKREYVRCRIASGQIKSVLVGQHRIVAKEWFTEYLNEENIIREYTQQLRTKRDKIVEFCHEPRSRQEIQDYFGYSTENYMRKVLSGLITSGRLAYTKKPRQRNQKYIAK